jgi:hypothetical protein
MSNKSVFLSNFTPLFPDEKEALDAAIAEVEREANSLTDREAYDIWVDHCKENGLPTPLPFEEFIAEMNS